MNHGKPRHSLHSHSIIIHVEAVGLLADGHRSRERTVVVQLVVLGRLRRSAMQTLVSERVAGKCTPKKRTELTMNQRYKQNVVRFNEFYKIMP